MEDTHWLRGVPRSRAISSFKKLFGLLGYEDCDLDTKFERGTKKVAIYAKGGDVKHAAIQSPQHGGRWHSKIGGNVNILHELDELAGEFYGEVVLVMRQQRPSPESRVLREMRDVYGTL